MDRAERDVFGLTTRDGGGEPHTGAAADWTAEAIPNTVGRLRGSVTAFVRTLGAADALVQDIRLAISEALSNAVIHAYPDHRDGRLDVHAHSDRATGLLTLRVRDYGVGFRARTDSPGIGMGIPIMTTLARTIDVACPDGGGTEVRLTFAVSASAWLPRSDGPARAPEEPDEQAAAPT